MAWGLAWRAFVRALIDKDFAAQLTPLLTATPAAKPGVSGEPVRVLGLLQRDGRLIDFLCEEIADYSDAQIGAAVRDIHRDCRAALLKHVALEPILEQEEGKPVTVPAGFDPHAIRLTGNVKGAAPFRGTCAHRGWRVKRLDLPERVADADDLILAPAEVEIP